MVSSNPMPAYDAVNARCPARLMTSCRPSTSRGRSPGSVSIRKSTCGRTPGSVVRSRTVPRDNGSCTPTTSVLIDRHAEGALHVGELRQVPRAPHAEPHVVVGGPERRRVARPELTHASVRRGELVARDEEHRGALVIHQVLADAREVDHAVDADLSEVASRADPGPQQQRRRLERARREDHTRAAYLLQRSVARVLDPDRAALLEQHPGHLGARPDRQVPSLRG